MRGLIVQREAQLAGQEQEFSSGQVGADLRQALDQFRQRLAEVKHMKERRERAKEAASGTAATPGPPSTPAPAMTPTPAPASASLPAPAPVMTPTFAPTYEPRYAPTYAPSSAFTPAQAATPAPAPAFASTSRAAGNVAVGNGVARQDDEDEEDDDEQDDSLLQRGTKRPAATIDISDDEDTNDGPAQGAGPAGAGPGAAGGGVGAAGERRRAKRRKITLEIKDTSSAAVAEAIKEVGGQMASAIRDGGNTSLVVELLRRIERMEARISNLEATVEELRNQE
jgi:hypothetical protein